MKPDVTQSLHIIGSDGSIIKMKYALKDPKHLLGIFESIFRGKRDKVGIFPFKSKIFSLLGKRGPVL